MAKVDYNPIKPGDSFSARAGAAIDQYNCVKIGATEGLVIETAGANEAGIGFMHTGKATAANDHVTVYTSGVVWARAAGSVTYGDILEATTDGEVTTETPANGVDQNVVGTALGAADAGNELIPVLIQIYKYNNESV